MTDWGSYGSVRETMRGRDTRKVCHNTWLELRGSGDGADVALRFHATDIITWHADGSRTVRPWDSVTTRRRFSDFLAGASINTESGFQRLTVGSRYHAGTWTRGKVFGVDGTFRIGPRGGVTGKVVSHAAHDARIREHKRDLARWARERRREAQAREHAAAVCDAARAVFGYAFAGDVARRETDAVAFLAAMRRERYAQLRATGAQDGGPLRAVLAWDRARVARNYYDAPYDTARRHAVTIAGAVRRSMVGPIAYAYRERERSAVRTYNAVRRMMLAPIADALRGKKNRAIRTLDAVRAVFEMPFHAIAVGRRNHLWLARHGVDVDADGCAWLYKNVRVLADGLRVSDYNPRTRWDIGCAVDDSAQWDPTPRCGGGLHASPTAAMAAQYVDPGTDGALMVRVRVADMVLIGEDKCKVPRVLDVAVRNDNTEGGN